jgi:hypothetical protein
LALFIGLRLMVDGPAELDPIPGRQGELARRKAEQATHPSLNREQRGRQARLAAVQADRQRAAGRQASNPTGTTEQEGLARRQMDLVTICQPHMKIDPARLGGAAVLAGSQHRRAVAEQARRRGLFGDRSLQPDHLSGLGLPPAGEEGCA